MMATKKKNLHKRIEKVQQIVEENYEPGNQSKCKLQAFRKYVNPIYPMSERTFWRYMNTKIDNNEEKENPKQMKFKF